MPKHGRQIIYFTAALDGRLCGKTETDLIVRLSGEKPSDLESR